MITWNDLGQALFPNAATADPSPTDTPARGVFAPDGVFKRGWAGIFFSSGRAGQPVPGVPLTCGRFTAAVCAAYTEAATTGRLSPATAALLARSSPASVTARITAPTLLVQGEQDTLFGLDQADANARQIAAHGTPVKVGWYAGGHDGGGPDQGVRDQVAAWFDHYLAGRGPTPEPTFSYAVQSGVRAGANTPTGRTVVAPVYPGLSGAPTTRQDLPLSGERQTVVNPALGSPAAITSLPGLGGALGAVAGRLTAISGALPGQVAQFATAPVAQPLTLAGAPLVRLSIARVPGQPAPADAVLFAGTSELAPDGTRTLLGSAVAPMRVAVPADGSPVEVTLTLPGVVAPVEAGHALVVTVATTDQGYAGGTAPAVWRIGATGGGLSVPLVPGEARTANTVPPFPAIGIGVILAGALLAGLVARLRRRPTAGEPDLDAPPLRVTDLAKTYKGGFSAVKGVSFAVERGMVLGLLGPNGAGKTTVLRMLMGLIRPTAGTLTAFGEEVRAGAPVLARIGAFVEGPGFLPHLSGKENLDLYWSATGRPNEESHVAEALDIAGLGTSIDRRVGTYSQGMRQRLAHRAGHARAAGPARARRADQRARPSADPRYARGAAPLRGRRAHRARVEPPAGRGGADVLARGRHAPREDRRGGHRRADHRRGWRGDVHGRHARARRGGARRADGRARRPDRRRVGARRAERHPARRGRPCAGGGGRRRHGRRTAPSAGGRVPAARGRGPGAVTRPHAHRLGLTHTSGSVCGRQRVCAGSREAER